MASTQHPVKVQNLPRAIKHSDLYDRFAAHGSIDRFNFDNVSVDGTCTIGYKTQRGAETAVAAEAGQTLLGRAIRVEHTQAITTNNTTTQPTSGAPSTSSNLPTQRTSATANTDQNEGSSRGGGGGGQGGGPVMNRKGGRVIGGVGEGSGWGDVRMLADSTVEDMTVLVLSKTGMITDNGCSVEYVYAGGKLYGAESPTSAKLSPTVFPPTTKEQSYRQIIYTCILTSSAYLPPSLLAQSSLTTNFNIDSALLSYASRIHNDPAKLRKTYPGVMDVSQSSDCPISIHVRQFSHSTGDLTLYCKGSGEEVLGRCAKIWDGGMDKPVKLTDEQRQESKMMAERMGQMGFRVLAIATLPLRRTEYPKTHAFIIDPPNYPLDGFTYFGLVALTDGVREGVKDEVLRLKSLGVKIWLVSGDGIETVRKAAKRSGILSHTPTIRKKTSTSSLSSSSSSTPSASQTTSKILNANAEPLTDLTEQTWTEVLECDEVVIGGAKSRDVKTLLGWLEGWEYNVGVLGKKLGVVTEELGYGTFGDGNDQSKSDSKGDKNDDEEAEREGWDNASFKAESEGSVSEGEEGAVSEAEGAGSGTASEGEDELRREDLTDAELAQQLGEEEERGFKRKLRSKGKAKEISSGGGGGGGGRGENKGKGKADGGDDDDGDRDFAHLLSIPMEAGLTYDLTGFTPILENIIVAPAEGKARHPVADDCSCDGRIKACRLEDDCDNVSVFWEGGASCKAGDACRNKRLQGKQWSKVELFAAGGKGLGVRAVEDIDEGALVAEYLGEVIGKEEFDKRVMQYDDAGHVHLYFMALDQGEVVDAMNYGNVARWLNHSCTPNCTLERWSVGEEARVGLYAKTRIKAGSELVFDYAMEVYGQTDQVCECGSANCRGVINGKAKKKEKKKQSSTSDHHDTTAHDHDQDTGGDANEDGKEKEMNGENGGEGSANDGGKGKGSGSGSQKEDEEGGESGKKTPDGTGRSGDKTPDLGDGGVGGEQGGAEKEKKRDDGGGERDKKDQEDDGTGEGEGGQQDLDDQEKKRRDGGVGKGDDETGKTNMTDKGGRSLDEREGKKDAEDNQAFNGGSSSRSDGVDFEGCFEEEEGKKRFEGLVRRLRLGMEKLDLEEWGLSAEGRVLFAGKLERGIGMVKKLSAYLLGSVLLLTEGGDGEEDGEFVYGNPMYFKNITDIHPPKPHDLTAFQINYLDSSITLRAPTANNAQHWTTLLNKRWERQSVEDGSPRTVLQALSRAGAQEGESPFQPLRREITSARADIQSAKDYIATAESKVDRMEGMVDDLEREYLRVKGQGSG
ncbi:histone methyltransferase set2 [Rhizophlyctis rosea]|nr:histone methyltransferase set2 [Rhizophlyctis rosea]